jgi:hypothetical protein
MNNEAVVAEKAYESLSLKAELEKVKIELANVVASKELLHSDNKALSHLNRIIADKRNSNIS